MGQYHLAETGELVQRENGTAKNPWNLEGRRCWRPRLKRKSLTLRGFDEVRPRPLRGPRASNFDEISTWGYVQGPNRLEPSSFCTSSANTALRNARTAPRFAPIRGAGVIWRGFRRLSACFGVGSPFYWHRQSALGVIRLPTAQIRM